ncbi:MAG: hypothetical protein IT323_13635 [Anaerolineae bacterium]|nr:hypothetical protein [Anaerolineae bacterium]
MIEADRTIVPYSAQSGALVLRRGLSLVLPEWVTARWERVGNRLGLVKKLKNVAGPLKLRQILSLSGADMRRWIYEAGGRMYSKATLSHWERAERCRRNRKPLPRGYWKRQWMPKPIVEWFHKLIVALVIHISGGTYVARVKHVRVPWKIELWRTR